jgi:hypothetical protein
MRSPANARHQSVALELDPVAIAGEWIRHAPHRSDLPGRGPRTHPTAARNAANPVRGLYLADEPGTTIAGWYRDLVERGLHPARPSPTTTTSGTSKRRSLPSAPKSRCRAGSGWQ